jgi:argininosuccinate lyase
VTGGAAPELIDGAYAYELRTAAALHDGLNLADMAHLLQLVADGIVPSAPAAQLAGALARADAVEWTDFGYDAGFGEPYSSRERRFEAELGDAAGWLHAGRPRREATRVAFRLHLRREVCRLVLAAARLAAALASRAREHRGTLFADHTYLQPAQPSTVGHYLTSFAYPVLRDGERLLGVVDWLNGSPCGAGAVNGSRLVADRGRTAAALGFDHVIVNTRDAMWQVDGLIELGSAVTSLACTQTSLAEDLEIWASEEFGYVELGGGYARTSVLMPQKRNPYALSMIRGAAGVLIGRLTGLVVVQKNPSARSDSLIMAYGEVPAMLDEARRTTELTAGVVETLTLDEDRLRRTLDGGSTQATDLADELMRRCGLDYRRAYRVAGRALRGLAERGQAARDLTPDVLEAAAVDVLGEPLATDPGDLGAALDPAEIVATRTAVGGAAPAAVDEMADEIDGRRLALAAAAEGHLARFGAAETALRRRCRALAWDGTEDGTADGTGGPE